VADLEVQLLATQDCPHLAQARQDLETVLHKGIIEVPIQLVFVSSPDDAEFLEFQGSPTIRINGEDVVLQPELPIAYGCRVYRDAEGRMVHVGVTCDEQDVELFPTEAFHLGARHRCCGRGCCGRAGRGGVHPRVGGRPALILGCRHAG